LILKSWDLCHLKANVESYSGKFESLHLHVQIKFYGISKFTEQTKSSEHFLKKISRGPDPLGTGRNSADPAQIHPRRAGDADSNGWQARPAGQRLWQDESVRADLGRPIK
jgi:hypothetical protein